MGSASRSEGLWSSVRSDPDHPLAQLEGVSLGGAELRVLLGPTSRFGARYFQACLSSPDSTALSDPVVAGLHSRGPLVTYNWIEVAETRLKVAVGGNDLKLDEAPLLRALLSVLPLGGHLMVEYDSPQRADTARALAAGVPAIATPLGELLFSIGCGARFKDWQIAEGGSEGPRKLQAYRPLSEEVARRWRSEARVELQAFLGRPGPHSPVETAARLRATRILPLLLQG